MSGTGGGRWVALSAKPSHWFQDDSQPRPRPMTETIKLAHAADAIARHKRAGRRVSNVQAHRDMGVVTFQVELPV